MYTSRAVSLALVGLFVWVTGCMSYQRIEIAELPDFDEVRVTVDYGAEYDLRGPRVESDTLYGLGEHVSAIPMSEVAKIEARQSDTGATVALVAGALLVAGGIALAIYAATADPMCFGCEWDNTPF